MSSLRLHWLFLASCRPTAGLEVDDDGIPSPHPLRGHLRRSGPAQATVAPMVSLSTAQGGRVHIGDSPPRLGGEAAVYPARISIPGQPTRACVVKVALQPGPAGAWLRAEAARLVALGADPATAPWVPAVLGDGDWHDRPFVVLEEFEETLAERVARTPAPQDRLLLALGVARAVAALHAASPGLVHRDLKPTNVLLTGDRVVISDFGAARDTAGQGATTTVALATAGYAPPEQSLPHRRPQRSWDVYGLAATLFFALTGEAPEGPALAARRLTPAGRAVLAGLDEGRGPTTRYLDLDAASALTAVDRARLRRAVRGPLHRALKGALAPHPDRRRGQAADLVRATLRSWAPGTRPRIGPAALLLGIPAVLVLGTTLVLNQGQPGPAYPALRIEGGTAQGTAGPEWVEPFSIGQTEVSQALWAEVMGAGLSTRRRIDADGAGLPCARFEGLLLEGPDLPMICIDTLDAARFANALSERQGLNPAYAITEDAETGVWTLSRRSHADGWRLPTVAEWRLAARPDPDWTPCDQNVADLRWQAHFPDARFPNAQPEACSDGFAGLAPVGSGRPDGRGLRQGRGNVNEWLEDLGPGHQRWVAGGSFASPWAGAPPDQASPVPESLRAVTLGLRLARSAP